MAELAEQDEGSLQTGSRPVLIISNNKANQYSPVITVIPLTSRLGKNRLPTHVLIQRCGLPKPSIALAEQITSINKSRLKERMGSINQTVYADRVRQAIEIQLDS